MRRWLITGGAGFIGSNFVRYTLGHYPEDTVVVLDKLTYAGNRENLRDLGGDRRLRFVQGDIADPGVARSLIQGCDVVVNFAAESHVDRSIVDPTAFLQTNVIGTQVLLDAAVRATPRPIFVQISTDEVYGSTDGEPFREDSSLKPNSQYAASKAAADLLVRAYKSTFNLYSVITRSSNNYGPYQFPEKFIPLAITNAIQNEPIPLYGDGLQIRDWLHVEDNCRAIDQVIECHEQKSQDHTEIFNIGGGHDAEVTNKYVLETILKILDKPLSLIQYVPDRPGHDRRYAISTEKLQRKSRWAPTHRFENSLRNTVEWYRTHESWWRPLKARAAPHWLRMKKGTPCAS
ncbi:MAG: dTDP-glucose 4,6-dehydratase [Candidatus Omnitrophica bacterium]|nr:dTDP-glucose 4,6-dehydratase [Candidatus Omnitrophota bacterium]